MKRILTASLHHESNTFNPIITGREDFSIQYGSELFSVLNDDDSISGVVHTLQNAGYEMVPTVCARAVPNGVVSKDLYLELKEEILKRARAAVAEAPIDALCLSLHGSMRIEEIGEAEGDLLEALREIFPDQPLFSSLDMHTTFSKRMHDCADGYVGYKCAPHIDCYETGEHAARLTIAALEEGVKTSSAWVKIPFLVAGEKSETTTEPMKTLISALRESEKKEKVLAANYLMGFPWADSADSGVSVLVITDNDKSLAKKEAARLADLFWSYRDEFSFHTETYSMEESLVTAFKAVDEGPTPIYISDSGDNPTAGSSGDCTNFLKLITSNKKTGLLDHPIIYGGFFDPDSVEKCRKMVGMTIELNVGAAFDTVTTSPLKLSGKVKSFINEWGVYKSDLALFSTGGVDIVLTSKHIGFVDPAMFRDLGDDPANAQIVVCKLGYLTAAQRTVSKRSIMALSEGSSNEDLNGLPYKLVPRPIFPLDSDFEYKAADNLYLK
ncbi:MULTISPECIES: M81 family metallopeptidase [unclassified Oceanispirochaeta]|uniref:M81 family metallopeptidase n=1 Tax=unclassified Oceanispirochaeta TaxID=2635722 RepID=UPI000E09BB99|nr:MULTISPECIES: M81 family metallopeptidase [unclassified Oceanispirochaeta]MBF9017881.1 M81 family metallopeptidase [Oceanispirochaeta sp. M2]NPD74392.1 M81 family metallopeptidase [Oceanispirochaeta sp. M1]RDG29777.1 microcystin LR degradation protein MlrC [Oceanispirochaeta sp. M1]